MHFLPIIIAPLALMPGPDYFMPKWTLMPYFFAISYTLPIYAAFGRCPGAAHLGTKEEKVATAVGIAKHAWTIADHRSNVNVVGVVRFCGYIQTLPFFIVVDRSHLCA